jgi:hypothetical protein
MVGAWVVIGDFNLTRAPEDKNNDSFNSSEAMLFNNTINRLALVEIHLVDRAYTWSNNRADPTLVRLDRCFVNILWESIFPNTALSSLTRAVSDHVPLLLTASTKIPKSKCFCFENAWLQHPAFKGLLAAAITSPISGTPSFILTRALKTCRSACRTWAKRIHLREQREIDTKILIDALDLLEEARPLSPNEATL